MNPSVVTSQEYFATLVAPSEEGAQLPLTEAALSIAQDVYPELDIGALQVELDRFAATLKARLPADAAQAHRLRCLNRYFFGDLGFAVNRNDYYDPDNSYLNRVVERRIGIPISLAILYMEIGQQVGLSLRGVSFPGHFLVKLKMRTGNAIGDVFLDPCDGKSLSREQLEQRLELFFQARDMDVSTELALVPALHEADAREILVRMLRNLKSVYSQQRDFEKLLDIQKRLVIVTPDRPEERRDRGLVYAQLECPQAALDDLNFYLEQQPEAADAKDLRRTVAVLQSAAARPRH